MFESLLRVLQILKPDQRRRSKSGRLCRFEPLEVRQLLAAITAAETTDVDDQLTEIASAVPLTKTTQTTLGTLTDPTDVDLIGIDAVAGQEISVSVVSESQLLPRLRLFGPPGIGDHTSIEELGFAIDFRTLSVPVTVTGRYYVGVSELSNETYSIVTGGSDLVSPDATTGEYEVRISDTSDIVSSLNSIADIDGDGELNPFQDAVLLFAWMSAGTPDSVYQRFISSTATRRTASAVKDYLSRNAAVFDIDQDRRLSPFQDAVLCFACMSSGTPDSVFQQFIGADADPQRDTPGEVRSYLHELKNPENSAQLVAVPVVQTPSETIGGSPQSFTWTNPSGATQFELFVTSTGSGSRIVLDETLSETHFTPLTRLPDGNYHAWVRARQENTWSTWSLGKTFMVTNSEIDSDPNGANDDRATATPLGQVGVSPVDTVKTDRLNENDLVDYFRLSVDRRYVQNVGFHVEVTLTQGSVDDLEIEVLRDNGGSLSLDSYAVSRSGTQLTAVSNRQIGSVTGLLIKLSSLSGADPIEYSLHVIAS